MHNSCVQLLKFSAHCTLESCFQNVALKEMRIYERSSYALGELWLVLKLSRILRFFYKYDCEMLLKFILFHNLKHRYNIIYNSKVYIVNIIRLIFYFTRNFHMLCWSKNYKKCHKKQVISSTQTFLAFFSFRLYKLPPGI